MAKFSQTPASGRKWTLDDVQLESVDPNGKDKVGWVYFIACKETERCKIGYTRGDPYKRLRNLQTGSAGQLRLMAVQPGTVETERALHTRFNGQNAHGEWFEMSEELFAYIVAVMWSMACIYADAGRPLDEWMKVGLRMLNDGMADVPPEMMALTE